jgi:hypothetical protein
MQRTEDTNDSALVRADALQARRVDLYISHVTERLKSSINPEAVLNKLLKYYLAQSSLKSDLFKSPVTFYYTKLANELLGIINHPDRKYPMLAVILNLNTMGYILNEYDDFWNLLSGFFSIYQHYLPRLASNIHKQLKIKDVWKSFLDKSIDQIFHFISPSSKLSPVGKQFGWWLLDDFIGKDDNYELHLDYACRRLIKMKEFIDDDKIYTIIRLWQQSKCNPVDENQWVIFARLAQLQAYIPDSLHRKISTDFVKTIQQLRPTDRERAVKYILYLKHFIIPEDRDPIVRSILGWLEMGYLYTVCNLLRDLKGILSAAVYPEIIQILINKLNTANLNEHESLVLCETLVELKETHNDRDYQVVQAKLKELLNSEDLIIKAFTVNFMSRSGMILDPKTTLDVIEKFLADIEKRPRVSLKRCSIFIKLNYIITPEQRFRFMNYLLMKMFSETGPDRAVSMLLESSHMLPETLHAPFIANVLLLMKSFNTGNSAAACKLLGPYKPLFCNGDIFQALLPLLISTMEVGSPMLSTKLNMVFYQYLEFIPEYYHPQISQFALSQLFRLQDESETDLEFDDAKLSAIFTFAGYFKVMSIERKIEAMLTIGYMVDKDSYVAILYADMYDAYLREQSESLLNRIQIGDRCLPPEMTSAILSLRRAC